MTMKRLLQELRFAATSLAARHMQREANKLLTMTERIPSIHNPELIRRYRVEVLCIQTVLNAWPVIQDDLSGILTQLRELESNLSG
jgi:hypothetical protein